MNRFGERLDVTLLSTMPVSCSGVAGVAGFRRLAEAGLRAALVSCPTGVRGPLGRRRHSQPLQIRLCSAHPGMELLEANAQPIGINELHVHRSSFVCAALAQRPEVEVVERRPIKLSLLG